MDLPALTPQQHKLKKLRRFNALMACLHFAQGYAILILSTGFSLPVSSAFVEFNAKTQQLAPMLQHLFALQIGPLVAIFLFHSAFAHFCLAFLPTVRVWYESNLKKGMNPARWIEYAFSSSLMMVLIVMLVGMYDGISLLLVFFLNATMILFGWIMELHNQTTKQTNWTSYVFSCIAGLVPWIAVALYLFNAGSEGARAPTFVYWIFFSIFIFFNVFAINMFLQYKKLGKWQDYLYGERVYIILSLVAKSLLAWQVFFGTLRPV